MESMKTAVSAYQAVQVDAAVLGASPHELIKKLLSKAIESTEEAKKLILVKDIEGKSVHIKIALTIIADGLRASLDMSAGGEIAENLDKLYGYMLQCLMTAHAQNDAAPLDEVAALLRELLSGWSAIKP